MCAWAMEHGTETRGLVLGIASPLPARRPWRLNHVIRFEGQASLPAELSCRAPNLFASHYGSEPYIIYIEKYQRSGVSSWNMDFYGL